MKPLAIDGKRTGPMPRPSPLGRPSGLLSGLSATSGVAGGLPKAGSNADLRALDFKPTAERMDRNRSAMVRRRWIPSLFSVQRFRCSPPHCRSSALSFVALACQAQLWGKKGCAQYVTVVHSDPPHAVDAMRAAIHNLSSFWPVCN